VIHLQITDNTATSVQLNVYRTVFGSFQKIKTLFS